MHYHLRLFFNLESSITILHILHALPLCCIYTKINITYITCITPSADFFTPCQYYTYYMHYHLRLFFNLESSITILHILHALRPLLIFSQNQYYIYYMHYPLCKFFTQCQYYSYYMHYLLCLFLNLKFCITILHILHALPPLLNFHKNQ